MNYAGITYIRILLYQKKTSITCIDTFILLQSLCILYTYKLLIEINRYIIQSTSFYYFK